MALPVSPVIFFSSSVPSAVSSQDKMVAIILFCEVLLCCLLFLIVMILFLLLIYRFNYMWIHTNPTASSLFPTKLLLLMCFKLLIYL